MKIVYQKHSLVLHLNYQMYFCLFYHYLNMINFILIPIHSYKCFLKVFVQLPTLLLMF